MIKLNISNFLLLLFLSRVHKIDLVRKTLEHIGIYDIAHSTIDFSP